MTRKHCTFRPRVDRLEDRWTPATLPSGFLESSVGTATNGTQMDFSPDGKLYVLEQAGTMKVFQGSGTSWTQVAPSGNFFTGSLLSVNSPAGTERGLLGIAFDPQYATNHYLYCYYTTPSPTIHNRISRFTANTAGTQVVAGSETVLMDLETLGATNHNGGGIHFGPDGMLYVGVGENAVMANAQSISNRLGKILRLTTDPANPIPPDNPTSFPNISGTTTGVNRAIWSVGLRNPFTFAFQPGTSRMYINDVGNTAWEEIDTGVGGVNYGWSIVEGPSPAGTAGMTYPFLWYNHSNPALASPTPGYTGGALVGGAFYNAANYTFPADYANDYFLGDEVSSWIRRYDYTTNSVTDFATNTGNASDLKVGPDGALYYLSRASSAVFRVRYNLSVAPYIVTQPPATLTVSEGKMAKFTVAAGGSGMLQYQWQRNNVDIPGANSATYTIASASLADNNATFRVIISNGVSPNATSNATTLTVNPNQPPVPTILTPMAGAHFNYGEVVNYSGSATDPEDGTLAGAAFTWSVDYFTGGVPTQVVPPTSGSTSGQFTIPTTSIYTGTDVFYRIHLVVSDLNNVTTEVTRDILPNVVSVTLDSSPTGAPLTLDGIAQTAPYTFMGVTGLTRSIGTPANRTIGGLAYSFASWSDSGALTHSISTPAAATTYTANYVIRPPRVADLRIDEGGVQRSMVRSLRVTFDAMVNYVGLSTDAFTLNGPGGSFGLNIAAIDNSTGNSVITMTFSGPSVINGSLPNGDYAFTVIGAQLTDSLSQQVDGDANGSAGGDYQANFHRLIGDANGDRHVDGVDYGVFRAAFASSGTAAFASGLDFDNNGVVDGLDFDNFRMFFNTLI